MRRQLLDLYALNRGKGTFRAEATGNVIEIYDVIVGSDIEAEWFGGVSPQAFRRAIGSMSGDVTIRVNSPGGDVFGARAIEQAMREHDGQVTVIVDGYAASAASLVAAAAGKVLMAPGAMMMIHKAWSFAMGNADDMLQTAELLEKIDGTIAQTYAQRSGKDAEHFAELMAAETWFTAEEAVAEGLADEIAGGKPGAQNAFDLSVYAKAPPAPARQQIEPTIPDLAATAVAQEAERRGRIAAVRMRLAAA